MTARSQRIICYHGSPGHPDEFKLLFAALRRAPDSGGEELSARPRRGYPNFSETQVSPGALLVGYSWGCLDALKAAATSDVAGALLISPYLFPVTRTGAARNLLIRLPWIGTRILRSIGERAMANMLDRSDSPQAVPSAYWEIANRLSAPEYLRPAVLEKEIYASETLRVLREVAQLRVPIATVTGELDRISTDETQLGPMREIVATRSDHRIRGAGHALIWTHADEIARAIRSFQRGLV